MGVHVVEVAGEQGGLVAAGAGADFHDDAVEVLAGSTSRRSSSRVLQRLLPALQVGQLLLERSWRISGSVSAGQQGLGLGDVVLDLLDIRGRA